MIQQIFNCITNTDIEQTYEILLFHLPRHLLKIETKKNKAYLENLEK